METFIERFPLLVLHVFGGLLLALTPILFWCLLKRTGALDRLSAATHELSTRPRLEQMLVLVLLAGVIVYGSTKDGDNSASPRLRVRPQAEAPSTPVVTAADAARGWRVSGSDAGGPVEMPAGAVTNELLRRRGGFDWAFRVEPDNWRSFWKGGYLTGVTVFARGEVRPDVGTLYYPVVVTNGVSLLPEARWGMLSHAEGEEASRGGAEARSVFSHAVTTNGSLLLDWRNAAVGRDANSPTNLQMEIFSDGSFVWRTDDGSTSYLPVLPFDWDGDGLENSVDPEPLAPNPVDAHGTSAEWYRIVCSNVFTVADDSDIHQFSHSNIPTFSDSNISFRPEVNTNAYYFVDVVAEEGPAPIWFHADRDSRLGSPVVVARASETNRVPLLIGVEYAVTSTVPFSVTLQEGGFAETNRQGGCSVTVKWPLDFAFVEDADAPGAYTVEVVPYDPGVAFTWNSPVPGGGASLLSAAPPSASSCSCWSGSGSSVVFDCSDNCDCGGGCQASGTGGLEDAEFAVTGGVCRCSSPDEPHEDTPPLPDPLVGGLLISFSERAVIFEDEYRNTENGPLVPRRSTTTRLTVSASGGPFGGSFSLTTRNLEKLAVVGGSGVPTLPTSKSLEPFETYSATFECEGAEASDSEGDVEVSGVFVGGVPASVESPSDSTTVVKVELEVEDRPPQNPVPNRHIYGLREKVFCRSHPSGVGVEWLPQGDLFYINNDSFHCPWTDGEYTVTATLGGACLDLSLQVCVPIVECRSAAWRSEIQEISGVSGFVGMTLALYLTPGTVSFRNIYMVEIPVYAFDAIPATGYFALMPGVLPATHDNAAGAGEWKIPWFRNGGNYWTDDMAQQPYECPPLPGTYPPAWTRGLLRWAVPVGFGEMDAPSRYRLVDRVAPDPTDQVYEMDDGGTLHVRKYRHTISRDVDGRIWLDGSRVNAWWSGWFQ